MRIALIQPETPGTEGWCPPLGLGYLGGVLEQTGHQVQLIDLNAVHCPDDELVRLAGDVDAVGITSTMASHREALRLSDLFVGLPILFGGPQASARPEPYVARKGSVVFRGEAEISLTRFLAERAAGRSGLDTPGLVYSAADGSIVNTGQAAFIRKLDELPFPARHLFDMGAYTVRLEGRPATNMMSSRGCPFDCIFCYHDYLGKLYRARSPENIVAEIKTLQQTFDTGAILFYDDNFTLNRKRVEALCNLMIAEKLDVVWRCYGRVNSVDEPLLRRMKAAGCREVVFGVESGCQATLDRAHKRIRVEDSVRAVRLCREVGIFTKSYLMIGFPWETKADIEKTIDFIDELLPSQVHLVIVIPFPGTPLERMLHEQGIPIDEDIDITGIAQPSFAAANFTREDLIRYRDIAYQKIRSAAVDQVLSYQWRGNPAYRQQFEKRT